MKYYSTSCTFDYPWDQVTQAFWCRYPNPYATHVLTEDTVERKIDQGCLLSKRIITKKGSKVPSWGERFLPAGKQVAVVEESVVDPATRTLTTYTRNIHHTRVMCIEERCVYRPSTDTPGTTTCQREAFVTSGIFGFSRPLQSLGLDRFKRNISKTVQGFEHVLGRMFITDEGSEPETTQAEKSTKLSVNTAEKLKTTATKAKQLAQTKAASVVAANKC